MERHINHDRDALEVIVDRFEDGASLNEINEKLDEDIPRRTLQFRLGKLVRAGRLEKLGQGRSTRYRIKPREPQREPEAEDAVPL